MTQRRRRPGTPALLGVGVTALAVLVGGASASGLLTGADGSAPLVSTAAAAVPTGGAPPTSPGGAAARTVPGAAPSPTPVGPGRPRTGAQPGAAANVRPAPLPPAAVSGPRWLSIPRLGIRRGVIRLGLDAAGALEVPRSAADVGWFAGGPAPGQVGPAVLAGHVDSRTGPGVFLRLSELRPRDPITVTTANGRNVRFVVDRVERHPKDRFPTAAVYGPTPFAELRLITCGGTFDRASRHYRDNVVVFAKRG